MTDLRLAAPAVVAWVAAAVVIGVPAAALWGALGAFLSSGMLIVLRRPTLAVCAIGAALVCTVIAVQVPSRTPELLVEAASAGRHVQGSVVTEQTLRGSPEDFGGSDAFTASTAFDARNTGPWRARLVAANVGQQAASLDLPVLVFGEAPEAGIGATLVVGGTVQPAEPGDDVAFLIFLDGPAELEAPPPWFLDWANELRAGFRATATALPGDGGALLPGLAIGDTGAVSPALSAAMKSSALSHLTAVSGANCAIVIGLVLLAGARLGAPRAWRIGVAVAVLVAFIVLVTPEPSVVRAGVMALLVLVSLFFGRPVRGIPVLSLAVLVLLVLDPWLARNYGFILSVLATGGLLLLAGPLMRLLARWLPLWVSAVIAVPIAAQLACQPVLILLQPTIPAFGVVANLLAAPAAPIATVVGLLACVALPTVAPLGEVLARIAWLPSAWVAAVARFFASLPGAVPWLPGAGGALLLATVTVLGLLGVLQRRRWALLAALGLLVGLLGASVGVHVTQQLQRPQNWQIAACEVGQGDAVLVRSAGQVALIDTGPLPAPLTECLAGLGIGHLDLLVLTHFDLDHVGGVDAVVGRASRVLVGPGGSAEDDAIVQRLRDGGAVVDEASRGLTGLLGELQWTVLWPTARPVTEPGNDSSVAMTFLPVGGCESGCLSSVFLGDLGEQPQALMLAAGPLPRVDVVKVAHHGSADQSPRVYEQADATVGVIGVGENDYGHPNPRLLDLLTGVGTVIARTDTAGLVLLSPGAAPGEVALWTERPGDGGDDR